MFDVAIIGAGSMGMAAGYYLSKAGKSVALIDKNDPPHSEGSHHGESRIIRHAYGEGENYVPLALRSQQLWEEIGKEADTNIFMNTGVLNIGTANSTFLNNVRQSAKKFSLPVETLQAREINNRWPGFHLPSQYMGCYEKNSGILFSEVAIETYRKLAIQHGAKIYPNSQIDSIITMGNKVTINLNNSTIVANQLIITAGKGTNQITNLLNINLPLSPIRKTFSWFHSNEEIYNSSVFPAWSYDDGKSTYYGFPSLNGQGIKIGRHDQDYIIPANKELAPFGNYTEDVEETLSFAQKYFSPDIRHKEGKVCTYTNTPDGDFIIDKLPDNPNIIVACGFSGHGFKFSSGVGELLTEMVISGSPSLSIEAFRLNRF